MQISKDCLLLIAEFEGLSLRPYLCPAKKATIGYGNTYYKDGKKVTMLDKNITKEEALDLLKVIVDSFAKEVSKLVTSPLNQNQFNALVSFAYNVGSDIDQDNIPEGLGDSTLLKKVNVNPNDVSIINEFLKWNKAGGVVVQGLVNRRKKETLVYFKK